ncbi:MAG: antitoxin [Micropruina sp.]|nr:MAG: antitoxin [Micropruina sp.]
MGFVDKIKDAAAAHADQVNEGIDKAGDFVDDKTGGQYAGQVDQAQEFLKDQIAPDKPVGEN